MRARREVSGPHSVRLQLLRAPQVVGADGGSVPLIARDAALLALLAIDGPTARSRAIELLWPDEPDAAKARNALRQRLFRLRHAAAAELVASDELLTLAPGVEHDLRDLHGALAADPVHAVAGELLGSFAYDEWIDFSAWLEAAREQLRSRRRDVLAEIASRLEAEDRIAEALACAERLARDEPLLEHAQRRLMRLHYRRGDRAAALAGYARFRDALERELGDDPSAETRELAHLIEASGALPVAAAPMRVALLRPPRLVGREREWRAIETALAEGRIAVVRGEPGVGKSRLLGDFALDGWIAVAGRPGDARVPFALLARLARALVGCGGAPPLDAWARDELAHLLPELGPAGSPRIDPRRLQQAVEAALERAAPTGISIDDLQFADDATLESMPGLSATGGVRWLLALRSHEQPTAVTAWFDAIDAARLTRLELGPLDAAAVGELIASLALPGIDPASWAPKLHRHSGGNPMFILETLRALLGAGAAPADIAALPLPDNLRASIERRLAALSPTALKLARVAAVAGPDFGVDLAAAVLGMHALDLHDGWRELEAAQVVNDHAFAHDLIFETTRDSIPLALRRWLHTRIAEHLAAHGGLPVRLALHWRDADEPSRAAPCFEQAAENARRAGRVAEQARWLEAAIGAHAQAEQPAERFDAMVKHAIAAREALPPQAALGAAQALLDAATDARQRGRAHLQMGSCHLNEARFDVAFAQFDAAIAAASAAGDDDSGNHARYLQALASAQIDGPAVALARAEPLTAWAEGQADVSLRHSFVADFAILCDQADQRRRARPLFERALAYFDASRETGNAVPTRMMFARSLVMLGDLAQARALLEQAVRERNELSEDGGGHGIEVLNLGRVLCELGQYADALALLDAWRVRLVGPASDIVRSAIALTMARVYAHLGQTARAIVLSKEVVLERAPFHQRAALLWTQALLQHERPGERRRLLDAALACFVDTDLPFARLPIAFDRLACAPDATAIDALHAALNEAARRELPAAQQLGRMRLVQALLVTGDTAAAHRTARELLDTLARCQPVGAYLPEVYAACRAAALAVHDDALASDCLDRALRWMRDVARTQVPEPFRASFAQRNPVNLALLAAVPH